MSPAGPIPATGTVSPVLPSTTSNPAKLRQAAEQFEAILIGQILHSATEDDSGWLGTGDSSASCATDYAEEQLASAIARQGGFGLGKLILEGLERESGGRAPAANLDVQKLQPPPA